MNIIGLKILERREGLVTVGSIDMWIMRVPEMTPFILSLREEAVGMQMKVTLTLPER